MRNQVDAQVAEGAEYTLLVGVDQIGHAQLDVVAEHELGKVLVAEQILIGYGDDHAHQGVSERVVAQKVLKWSDQDLSS